MGRRKVCWNTRGNKLAVVTNDGDDKKGEDSGRNIVVFDIWLLLEREETSGPLSGWSDNMQIINW